MKLTWFTPELKEKVKLVFRSRCGRELGDGEIEAMAANLAYLIETIFKFEWRMKYGTKA